MLYIVRHASCGHACGKFDRGRSDDFGFGFKLETKRRTGSRSAPDKNRSLSLFLAFFLAFFGASASASPPARPTTAPSPRVLRFPHHTTRPSAPTANDQQLGSLTNQRVTCIHLPPPRSAALLSRHGHHTRSSWSLLLHNCTHPPHIRNHLRPHLGRHLLPRGDCKR